jgi:agmatinase
MPGKENQFLGKDNPYAALDTAAAVVVPFPYEGGVSFGKGAALAPEAVIHASNYVELYDEVLKAEPYRMGIATSRPPAIPQTPEKMIQTMYETVLPFVNNDKVVVCIGGDHSISSGFYKALKEKYRAVSVIQLDAHADLRDTYEGSALSHACVMARIRETGAHTLQIGIRSMSVEEAQKVESEKIPFCTMHEYRRGSFDVESALTRLPDPVFLTVDVDVFDWSVIFSTGTPEPGGFSWDEGIALLHKIFTKKNIVGCDVVELSYNPGDQNSPFAAAKLIYKMLGFKLLRAVIQRGIPWPRQPQGALFKSL